VPCCGETPRHLAVDGLQVVAALVEGDARAAADVVLSRGPLFTAAPLAAAAAAGRAAADLRGQAPLGLGSAADRRRAGHPHATVWRTLKRAGISRPARQPREHPRLYEWPCPGDLLHIDSKRCVRFSRPGHAVTGDRYRSGQEKRMRIGYEWVHSIVDDHSRYAYRELHQAAPP